MTVQDRAEMDEKCESIFVLMIDSRVKSPEVTVQFESDMHIRCQQMHGEGAALKICVNVI